MPQPKVATFSGNTHVDRPGASPSQAIARVLETPELLAHILNLLDRRLMRVFCRVSKNWTAVIGEHTDFGAYVQYQPRSAEPVRLLSRDLLRSGQRKVSIYISWLETEEGNKGDYATTLARIMCRIAEHKQRIRGLAFVHITESNFQSIWLSLSHGMPCLAELILKGRGFQYPPHAPNAITLPALLRAAPQLRRLVCSRISIGFVEQAQKVDIIEIASGKNPWTRNALAFWSAPWRDDITVIGMAVREIINTKRPESWVATEWSGHVKHAFLNEHELVGIGMRMTVRDDNDLWTPYRRIAMDDGLYDVAFKTRLNDLIVLSMPLRFLELALAEHEGVQLPALRMLHLIVPGLDDEESASSPGRLTCPRITNIALQTDKMLSGDEPAPEDECVMTGTYRDAEQLVEGVINLEGEVMTDLFADQFDLSGTPEGENLRFRTLQRIKTFESWIREVYDC